ncbi:MAG: YcxB family protein [Nonlabens sp.]|uniref:YcxB family protein n=1 Tax=Nonlabens sp. TaxID=1888209 RepID=UPI003EF7D7F4
MEYESEDIKIEYVLTKDEFANHYFKVYFDKPWKKIVIGIRILSFIICVAALILLHEKSSSLYILGLLILYFGYTLFEPFIIKGKNRKIYSNHAGSGLKSKLVLDKNGIESTNAVASTKIDWSGIIKVSKEYEMIKFYVGEKQSLMIPVKYFENQHFIVLKTLLSQNSVNNNL